MQETPRTYLSVFIDARHDDAPIIRFVEDQGFTYDTTTRSGKLNEIGFTRGGDHRDATAIRGKLDAQFAGLAPLRVVPTLLV